MILLPKFEEGIIKTAIPHAREVTNSIAVPHKVTETRVLNNIGYDVPSPIYYYYDWPNGKGYTPYESQVETAAFLTKFKRAFVLNDIGCGKTLSALWALDYMMTQGDVGKVLIVSPLSTIEQVWKDEVFLNFTNRKTTVLKGSKAKRLKLLAEDVDFYIINPEGVCVIWEELLERKDIDHILVDEVAEYKEARTSKFAALETLIKSGKSAWGMTGTPTPSAPTDAWAQIKLINPKNTSKYFNRFRTETMTQVTNYKWVAKEDAHERVISAMQPAIRYTRDECYDLPDATSIDLEVELSKEQTDAYKQMRDTLVTEYNNGEIQAANEGIKMSKLIQIAAGMVLDSEGVAQQLPCSKRLNELTSVITNAGTKVIVFVPFRSMLEMVRKEVAKKWETAVVHGGVSPNARREIFSAFQGGAGGPHVLVAHPKCMAHGLTLTEAATIVWYAPYPNSNIYTQANGRITRNPQKNNQFFIHLQGTEIERRVYKKLRDNQATQGSLLEMFENNS